MTTLGVPAGELDVRHSGNLMWVRARAEWAPEFALYPLETVDDVIDAVPSDYETDHSYLWAWQDKLESSIRSRMFAPKWESPRTKLPARQRCASPITSGNHFGSLRTGINPAHHPLTRWVAGGGGRVVAEQSRTL